MKFIKTMIMSPADEGSTGGGSSQSQSQSSDQGGKDEPVIDWKAKFEETHSKLEGLSKDLTAVKGNSEKLLQEKNKAEAKLKEINSKSLEAQGDFKTLFENEKQRVKDLEIAMDTIKQEEQSVKEKLLIDAKMEHAYKLIGGRDRFHNPEDIKDGQLDKIVIDPTTGKFSESGSKVFLDDFLGRLGYRLKSSEGDATAAAGKPMVKADGSFTDAELAKMPFREREAYLIAQANKK